MTQIAFWVAMGLVVYTIVVFPILVLVRSLAWPQIVRTADGTPLPLVSVVIAARNEEEVIGTKIESVLASDYPAERLEVIVVSDGSTDRTDLLVREFAASGVELVAMPAVGKAAALGAASRIARGEILVFTDANGVLAPDALRSLVLPFGDPTVGGVAGDQRYSPQDAATVMGSGERGYWSLDRLLKRAESRGGNVISATGGLYAIRPQLFEEVPAGATDDAFLSLGVIANGFRLVFAPEAVVYEPLAPSSRNQFERKVRVMTRGLQTVWARRTLLNPFRFGFYAVQFWSHKLLRRLMVLPLATMFLTGMVLWPSGLVYRVTTVSLLGCLGLGALGLALSGTAAVRLRPLALISYFGAMNAAALAAIWNVLRGHSIEAWQPQRRVEIAAAEGAMFPSAGIRDGGTWDGVRVWAPVAVAAGFGGLAAFRPLPVVACIVVAGVAFFFARRPDLATVTAVVLLYSNAVVVAVRIHGAPTAIGAVIPILLAVPLVWAVLLRGEGIVFPSTLPFVVSYLLAQGVSTARAHDQAAALGAMAVFAVEGLGLYLVMTNVIRTGDALRRALVAVVVVAALLGGLAAVKAVTGSDSEFLGFALNEASEMEPTDAEALSEDEPMEDQSGASRRQRGPIGETVRFGQILLVALPIAVVFDRYARTWGVRVGAFAAMALIVLGIAFTGSRAAFLGLAVSLLVMVVLRHVKVSHVAAALALLAVLLLAVPSYRERLLSIGAVSGVLFSDPYVDADSSIRGRYTENAAALLAFFDHPLTGVGPGNFPLRYHEYARLAPERVQRGERNAHNLFLGVAAETGTLGLLCIGGLLFVTVRDLIRVRRRARRSEDRLLAEAFLVVVAGLMTTSLFLHFAFIRYFWFTIALATVTASIASRSMIRGDFARMPRRPGALKPLHAAGG